MKSPSWFAFYLLLNDKSAWNFVKFKYVAFSEYMNSPTVWPINDVTVEIVSRLSGISSPGYEKKKLKNQKYYLFVVGFSCFSWVFSDIFPRAIIVGPHGILHSFLSQLKLIYHVHVIECNNMFWQWRENCLKKLLTESDITNPEFRLCKVLIIYQPSDCFYKINLVNKLELFLQFGFFKLYVILVT